MTDRAPDSTLPEVQAWRGAVSAFAMMGNRIGLHGGPTDMLLIHAGNMLKKLATRQAQEIARLTQGPYEAKPCRGHWHVYSGNSELSEGSFDEAGARARAAEMNADHKQDVNVLCEMVAERTQEKQVAEARIRVLEGAVREACGVKS